MLWAKTERAKSDPETILRRELLVKLLTHDVFVGSPLADALALPQLFSRVERCHYFRLRQSLALIKLKSRFGPTCHEPVIVRLCEESILQADWPDCFGNAAFPGKHFREEQLGYAHGSPGNDRVPPLPERRGVAGRKASRRLDRREQVP